MQRPSYKSGLDVGSTGAHWFIKQDNPAHHHQLSNQAGVGVCGCVCVCARVQARPGW